MDNIIRKKTYAADTLGKSSFLNGPIFHILLIALLGLIVYSNTFHVPFILDDEPQILDSTVIRDLMPFLAGAGYESYPRRFIGYLTLALNYRLGGLDVTGYHVFNLTVHIISACLVYALTRLTFRTPFFAGARNEERGTSISGFSNLEPRTSNLVPLLAALLFVCHPVQTQAVTYIIQRLASLATMFYLASLVLYVRARLSREEGKRGTTAVWYLFSLVSAVLAMKTKEIAFTLPLIAALYELFFFRGKAGRRILFLLPMLLTVVIIPLSMVDAGKPASELLSDLNENTRDVTTLSLSRGDYLITQFRVIVTYLRLLVLPVNQNLDYDYPVFHSLFAPPVFLSFLFLLVLFGLAVYLFYRSRNEERGSGSEVRGETQTSPVTSYERLISFGTLWFFITLSVESSIVPLADVIFEHRLYLPAVGAFIAVAAVFAIMTRKYPAKVHIITASMIVIAFSAVSWKRNMVWRDGVTIWEDVIRKSPGKVRPHYNLGYVLLYDKGRYGDAIKQFQIVLKTTPDHNAHNNMGVACLESGLVDEAIEHFQAALRIKPNLPLAHYNLGKAFTSKGDLEKAIEEYQIVLRLKPDFASAHNNLGVIYAKIGLFSKAIEHNFAAERLKRSEVK